MLPIYPPESELAYRSYGVWVVLLVLFGAAVLGLWILGRSKKLSPEDERFVAFITEEHRRDVASGASGRMMAINNARLRAEIKRLANKVVRIDARKDPKC